MFKIFLFFIVFLAFTNLLLCQNYQMNMKSYLSIQSKPVSRQGRYRSVKYKLSRQTSQSSVIGENQGRNKQIKLPTTPKCMYSRNKKNMSCFSNINNFGKSIYSQLQPSIIRKQSYMDSFNSLMNMEKNRFKTRTINERYVTQNPEKQSIEPQIRVQLPVLNQLDSHFTVLDNINLPINYLNNQICQIQEELKKSSKIIQQIKNKKKEMEVKCRQQIEDVEQMGKKGLQKLRGLLKQDRVNQQQARLKIKNCFRGCEDYLPQFSSNLENSKEKVLNLQQTIFKGLPYELKQHKQLEMLSTDYF